MVIFIVVVIVLVLAYVLLRVVCTPAPTHRITTDFYAVRCLFMNFYVLNTHVGVVLFDSGLSPRFAAWCLAGTGIASTTVTHVFLTHADSDHAGGLAAFPQAKVYLAEPELKMIDGSTPRFGRLHNKGFEYHGLLANGQSIKVGDSTIRTLYTPGHTPGSVSYLVDNRYLVTGDLLRMTAKGDVSPFYRLMNMDQDRTVRSLKALLPIAERVEYVLSGHSGAYRILPNKSDEPVLRGRHFR